MHDLRGEAQSYLDAYFVTAVISFSLHVAGPEWETFSGAFLANRLCAVLCSFDSFISGGRDDFISTRAELSFAYLCSRGEKSLEGVEYGPKLSAVALSRTDCGVTAERRAGFNHLGLAEQSTGSLIRMGFRVRQVWVQVLALPLNSGHVISFLWSSLRWGICLAELLRELNETKCLQLQDPLGLHPRAWCPGSFEDKQFSHVSKR